MKIRRRWGWLKRARSISDLPFLVAALAACLSSPARGEKPTTERSLASQIGRSVHKVENGIHKGSMVLGAPPRDPLGLIGAFQLDYALWTLLDEPVEDYLFRWELKPELLLPHPESVTRWEKTTVERVRREDPDLYDRLMALAPVSVTLHARVHFFDSPTTTQVFAYADLDISPDLTAPSGKPQPLSVPGSPEWAAWLKNISQSGNCPGGFIADPAGCSKRIWKLAKRVELTNVSIIGVEWPEVEARMLFAEIGDRHQRAEQKTSDRTASDEDFWSKPAPPAPPPAAQRSEIRTKTVAETNRPLDQKAREARQKRYAAQDQKLFSFWAGTTYESCSRGEITVNVDKSLGDAAPTVTWDGVPLKGDAKPWDALIHHEFPFGVSLGDHTLDITLAGPRPISRHERVRCYDEEKTRFCLGGPCPRYRGCECRTVK